MKDLGFRLEKVTIEGFKAFTRPQSVPIDGKHSFMFGPNGRGKSSIIEAIVWCLFATLPGAEVGAVTNKFYTSGECRVELTLRNSEGLWTFERRLPPGGTRARARILDPKREERDQEEVFPTLSRLGHAAGTHIIVAQSDSARRRRADISDFELVLSSYLGLDPVPDLLRRLEQLLEEQEDVGKALAEEISDVEEDLQRQLHDMESALEELLRNPSWGEGVEPTRVETAAKIRDLANDIAKLAGTAPPVEGSPEQMLTEAQERLTQVDEARRSTLESQMRQRRAALATGEKLWEDIQGIELRLANAEVRLQDCESRLADLCGDITLDQLMDELTDVEAQYTQEDSRLNVVNQALAYCEAYSSAECPVCGRSHVGKELEVKLTTLVEAAAPDQIERESKTRELRERASLGSQLAEEIESARVEIGVEREDRGLAVGAVRSALEMSPETDPDSDEINQGIESLRVSVQALEATLESKGLEMSSWRRRISSLRSGLRFHEYRASQASLQNHLTTGLQPARDRYAEFEELVDTVRVMRNALDQAYNAVLDKCLPWINQRMTNVFRLLTQQVSFDEIRVERTSVTGGPRLVERVGSSDHPDHSFDPAVVLNGQANSARRLVPHFAFSAVQAEALQINWLLIDDPSQSFDNSHIELLLDLLYQAGSNAQIILATHETGLFEPQIRSRFDARDFGVIRINGFSRDLGPEFSIE